jgi:hypothetical protein
MSITATTPSDLDLVDASDTGKLDDDNVTKLTTPTVTGKAAAGATVVLYNGATVLGTTTADGSGDWSITSKALAAGAYKLTAKATESGVTSAASTSLTVTIDTKAPIAPITLDLLASDDSGVSSTDNITNITTPTISGKAEANATVSLYEGATLLGTATANNSGAWQITSGVTLSAGVHSLTAKATDLAGNTSTASAALSITIATTVAAPTLLDLSPASDKGSSISDDLTSVTVPVINGRSVAGATISLYDGSTLVGKTTATSSGAWSITTSKLTEGEHHLSATATDKAGNVSAASSDLVIEIDTTPASVAAAPVLDSASDSGSSSSDNITNVSKPKVSGNTEAGATVTLYDGTTAIGTAVADSSGDWSITSTRALSAGAHNLTVKTIDVAGNVSAASPALVLTIDNRPSAAPTALDLVTAADSGTSTVDNITNVSEPVVSGKAEAFAKVSLYEGSTLLGSASADASGLWQITSTITLGEGAHSLVAKAVDLAGNVSAASAALRINIDTTSAAPTALDLAASADRGVSSTDNITSRTTPIVSGKAEAGSTVALFDGATQLGKAVASANGLLTITSSVKLDDGVHQLTAVATDIAGNVSAASSALDVTIDTTAPDKPDAPVLDAASDTGASDGDNITKATKPKFTGTTEAGATVTLYDGGTVVGTAVADGSGDWSITSKELTAGVHKLYARATDLAGNLSPVSSALELSIDTSASAAPTTLDLPTLFDTGTSSSDNKTSITAPTITGKAEANISVSLYDGTTLLGTTTADSDGLWSLSTGTLSNGLHKLTAKTTDVAGNISAASSALNVTIDPAASGQQLIGTGEPDDFLLNSEAGAIKVLAFSVKNGDHLVLAHDYNGLSLGSAADVLALASVVGKDLVIDFGAGHEVTLVGYTALTADAITLL